MQYSLPESFVISSLFMIKIIMINCFYDQVLHFNFRIREAQISLGIISSFIYVIPIFKKLFPSQVCFIIALRIVLFMKGIFLALAYFCFIGAILLSAVLQIFRKEFNSRVFWNFSHSLFICNRFFFYRRVFIISVFYNLKS